jgi:hypothetical protein
MTKSEYQDLVEFLGPKFDRIDERFDSVEERLARVEVLSEENRHQIQIVAEGVASNRETMTREFAAVWTEFETLRTEMANGFAAVWTESEALRTEMANGFAAVRAEMADGFSQMKGTLN